ncbi:NADP-dependent oxidoreductase [Actinocatenispora sera]|uniref:NADPH:quinone reductase n=1 Tax=Actinocatenispora sera TaxID=390989 RepID=A0A810L300_9ACTN|nr:NADP-dependent oxidoreductase [Actinocatenispora sera]BCJ29910.1 NADPH:quinone reductase [Actinocatenispora sera]
MKAVVAHGYGGPDALSVDDVAVPRPGPGQIQVRIGATALNPADLRTLSGVLRDLTPLQFPYVLGSDFAGAVTELGPGVDRYAVGEQVFGVGLPRATGRMATMLADPPSLTTGTMAEYAVFEADTAAIARRPAGLDPQHAATLPIAGLTALAILRAAGIEPVSAGDPAGGSGPARPRAGQDRTVLVIGAAGGVGGAVVPLLAAAGARVLATGVAADEGYLRALGAAEVIGYRDVDLVAELRRRHPEGVDVLVNLALPGSALPATSRVLRAGGRVLNAAFPSPDPAAFAGMAVHVDNVYAAAGPGDLDLLARYAVDGTLPSTIGRRYRLSEAPRAYADLVGTHVRGKLVVMA